MLTYITHGCNQNYSFEYTDLQKYVKLHHPASFSYLNPEVCWLTSPMGIIKMLHFRCNQNYPFEYADLQKYVNLHHPVSFSYWNPEVCWLTSPMGAIKMPHLSMMTCIIHVCWRSNCVCWLASPLCALDLMKYADLHHPWV